MTPLKQFLQWLYPPQFNVAGAIVGGAVIGGVASNMSAGKAAGAQQAGIESSNAISQGQYNQTREDNLPFLRNGTAASNQLAYELGLSTTPGGAQYALGNTDSGQWTPNADLYKSNEQYRNAWDAFTAAHVAKYGYAPNTSRGSLGSDLAGQLAGYGFDASTLTPEQTAPGTNYNSLSRNFTIDDLNKDVVYNATKDFQAQQGQLGIDRQAAANGSLNSGATLKALQRFNTGLASQLTGDAKTRYDADRATRYNQLAGVAGTGQIAVNNVTNAGTANANTQSNNVISGANSRAASAIGGGNAINSGIGSITNYYQQQQLLDRLRGGAAANNPTIYGSPTGGDLGQSAGGFMY